MTRLGRLLLRAYPRAFRARHGPDLLRFWASQRDEPRYRGVLGAVRYGAGLVGDAVGVGLRMRWVGARTGEGRMRGLWTDVRLARRALARAPLFTGVATVTIALGIAATTAVFAVVEGVVLRPLPYPEPDRLVHVLRTPDPQESGTVAWPDFRDWRERAEGFDGLTAYHEAGGALEWESGAEELTGARVTRDFFDVMGIPLMLGRTFSEQEDRLGGAEAMILSHRMWVSRFEADPDVLGRTVPYAGSRVPIVGVAAEGFSAPLGDTRFWLPLQDDQLLAEVGLPTGTRTLTFLEVVGRLAPGGDAALVESRLRDLARGIDDAVGKTEQPRTEVTLIGLEERLVGDVRQTLFFLLAAAALVLVVAAATVAGLALSRAAARDRELAVRRALGAGRARLRRELLTEAVTLCGLAGVVGLGLAWLLQDLMLALAPAGLPRLEEVGLDGTTLAAWGAATLASALVVGLLPSLRASAAEPMHALGAGRGSSPGRGSLRPQQLLVSFQVGAAVVLLTGATLFAGTFVRLVTVDRGFESASVVVATIAPPQARYATPDDLSAFYDELLGRVRALPGVVRASTTYSPPLFGNDFNTSVTPEDAVENPEDRFWAGTVIVGDEYFETNGIPLLRGRAFGPGDRLGEPPVVIVNEALADRLWPGEDPLGKALVWTGGLGGSADSFDPAFFPREPMTVVGVAGDVRRASLADPPGPEYYRPHAQITWAFQYLLVRVSGDTDAVTEALREAVWSVDAMVPVREVRTLQAQVSDSVAPYRFRMLLLVAFAGLTSLLAMVGLYGVVSLAIARRVREMGVRIALGASRHDIVRGTLLRGLRPVVWGVLVGAPLSWAGARTLTSMLFETEPTDVGMHALVLGVTMLVGAAACWMPARRAGRVEPIASLRAE